MCHGHFIYRDRVRAPCVAFGTAAHSSQKPQHLSLQKPDVPPEALTSLDGSVLSWAIASPPSPSLSRKLFLGCWRVVSSACPDSAERVCCCRTPYRLQKTHAFTHDPPRRTHDLRHDLLVTFMDLPSRGVSCCSC